MVCSKPVRSLRALFTPHSRRAHSGRCGRLRAPLGVQASTCCSAHFGVPMFVDDPSSFSHGFIHIPCTTLCVYAAHRGMQRTHVHLLITLPLLARSQWQGSDEDENTKRAHNNKRVPVLAPIAHRCVLPRALVLQTLGAHKPCGSPLVIVTLVGFVRLSDSESAV